MKFIVLNTILIVALYFAFIATGFLLGYASASGHVMEGYLLYSAFCASHLVFNFLLSSSQPSFILTTKLKDTLILLVIWIGVIIVFHS